MNKSGIFRHLSHHILPYFLICLILVQCTFLTACSTAKNLGNSTPLVTDKEDEQASFDQFCSESFASLVTQDAMTLHFTLADPIAYGISNSTVGFSDITLEGQQAQFDTYHSLYSILRSFSYRSLTNRQQLVYDDLDAKLSALLKLEDYMLYEEPLSVSSGVHINLPILLCEYPFRNTADIDQYLELVDTIDIYFQQIYLLEAEKSKNELFMSDASLESVLSFCNHFGSKTDASPLITSFENRLSNCDFLSDQQRVKYQSENENLVYDKVLPSYTALAQRLSKLKGSGINEQGLSHYPKGKKYYSALLRYNTGMDTSVYQIFHAISDKRSSDLAQMSALFMKDTSLASKCNNYSYYESDPDKMLHHLQNAMATDFPTPCQSADTICPVDDTLAEYVAPAYYFIAPLDDYQNNVIHYNPTKTSDNLSLFTTMAHESYPGHLYQTTMSYCYGLEPIRTLFSCGGYTEGWATYVEMLSYHYTGMDSQLADVLRLNQSVLLSLYATSDIGIHYYGWDYHQTREFFAEYGIDNGTIVSEIYQAIIGDPANYLKYYVGYMKFENLRNEYSGSSKDFHQAILQIGPAPFSVIEKYLDRYSSSNNKRYISRFPTPRSLATAFMAAL